MNLQFCNFWLATFKFLRRLYRLIDGSGDKIILTSYTLEDLQGRGFKEAGRLIGEDILASITGTRERLLWSQTKLSDNVNIHQIIC